jgi:hypothetical protein
MGSDNGSMSGNQTSSEPSPAHKMGSPLMIAVIGALGLILAALIPVLIERPWHHDNPCTDNLAITSPSDGQTVTSSPTQGVKVTGTACNLNTRTGWLFDQDLDDGYYYVDYSTSFPTPVAVNNGSWAFYDAGIGNKGDKNVTYQITVVLASPLCTIELERAKPDSSGDFKFKNSPPGCQIEDTVAVVVTYP